MKNIFIITYDLIEPDRNYIDLLKKIKSYGTWAKICESSYLIKTDQTYEQVRNQLVKIIDENDKLFVGTLIAPAAWNALPESVSNWILKNLE
ncbi:MAG: hypothetical protein ABR980_13290 [Ignavibacteriaceae bacterium]|jgi:hypothetical protein